MVDFSFDELEKQFMKEDDDKEKDFSRLLDLSRYESTRIMLPWDVAELYNKIIHHELYKEKFADVREFAQYTGVSSATISTNSQAVDFDRIHNFDRKEFSVTKVYQLSRTGNDYEQFLEYISAQDMTIDTMNVKQIKESVDAFYGKSQDSNVEVFYEGAVYRLPSKVLKKYMIAEEKSAENEQNIIINSFSWRISTAQVAYKKIDKSVFLYNETGIPEDIREYWGIEKMNPGELREIQVYFKGNPFVFTVRRDSGAEPYRTKMGWKRDFGENLAEYLDYSTWQKEPERYYLAFEKITIDSYYLELIKI